MTCIALCKLSPFWLCFSPFWGNLFKDLLIWLIIGWQVCILDRVSDKYLYLLKLCCNYIFQVSILSTSTKVMKGNDNHWIFSKSHYLCSGNLRKKLNFDLTNTAQKMKFSIKDLFSKCEQIRSFLRIWSHLLKKLLMENFIFCAVQEPWLYFLVKSRNSQIFYIINPSRPVYFGKL